MKKGYVILEIGYEYNDEIYHTGNYGESYEAPNKIYTDKVKADADLVTKNLEKFKGLELGYYCYGIDEITHDEQGLIDFLNNELKMNVKEDEFWDVHLPNDMTDEQCKALMKLINLEFYTIHEVEIEE